MLRWFENLIDVFAETPDAAPPDKVSRFYVHYLKQAWGLLLVMGLLGLGVALVEVALFEFIGRLVDMARKRRPRSFLIDTAARWPGWPSWH